MFSNEDKRIQVRLTVSGDNITSQDLSLISDLFSDWFGGCSLISHLGYWKESAVNFLANYAGKVIEENGYTFIIEIMPDQFDLPKIKTAFIHLSSKADWVNVTYREVYAAHFSIADTVALEVGG